MTRCSPPAFPCDTFRNHSLISACASFLSSVSSRPTSSLASCHVHNSLLMSLAAEPSRTQVATSPHLALYLAPRLASSGLPSL